MDEPHHLVLTALQYDSNWVRDNLSKDVLTEFYIGDIVLLSCGDLAASGSLRLKWRRQPQVVAVMTEYVYTFDVFKDR